MIYCFVFGTSSSKGGDVARLWLAREGRDAGATRYRKWDPRDSGKGWEIKGEYMCGWCCSAPVLHACTKGVCPQNWGWEALQTRWAGFDMPGRKHIVVLIEFILN